MDTTIQKHNTISVGHHYTKTNTNNVSKELEVKTSRTSFYEKIVTDITTWNSEYLAIVLSVLLWFTDSDYPFDIFKLFFDNGNKVDNTNTSQIVLQYISTRGYCITITIHYTPWRPKVSVLLNSNSKHFSSRIFYYFTS